MDLAKQNVEQYYALSDKTCDDKIQYANILFLAKGLHYGADTDAGSIGQL